MRRISRAQKRRAQDDADRSTNLSLFATFLSVAVGDPLMVASPVVGVSAQVAFAAWAAALTRHAIVVQRVVRDPPDPDFRLVTSVRRPRITAELPTEDEFGRASSKALDSLLRSSSLASAMVRALERAQGAALANEPTFEEARFAEAVRYAQQFGEALRNFADTSTEVTVAVRRLPTIPQAIPRGGRLVTLLPDAVLAQLYRMGVPRGNLDIPVMERVNDDPRELFSRELDDLASVVRDYAEVLSDSPAQAFEVV